jgi:hypothetical protein
VWDAADVQATAWLEHGQVENDPAWLEAMARFHGHPMTSDLGRATHALIGARLDLRQGEEAPSTEKARRALAAFRGCRAPWWIRKALDVLQADGATTAQEIEEATAIDRSLGIARG